MNWFCELSQLNCTDLGQAISDIRLQLNVTIVFLLLLVVGGVAFAWLSRPKKRTIQVPAPEPQTPEPTQEVIDFEPQKMPLTTELWLQRQQQKKIIQKKPQIESIPKPIKPEIVQADNSWWANFLQGISTEFFGAVVTTILLGLGVLVFQQYQDVQNHKAELILQMGSPDNAFAVEAARQIRSLGWYRDGTLTHAYLWFANLAGANLKNAILTRANIRWANLSNADLSFADLTRVDLTGTDLTNADLYFANLTRTNLNAANLTNADLIAANLTNADLSFADLTNANLEQANLTGANLTGVTLPDGTKWTEDTDIERFTDNNHPDYWDICIEGDQTSSNGWYCN